MKRIFLTSSVNKVAEKISKEILKEYSKLVFIKTASEVEEGDLSWLKDDRDALISSGFEVHDYTITNKTQKEIKEHLSSFDIIFFSGGNAFYLLQQIQLSKCAEDIKELITAGKIFIGSSAGSIIAGPDIYPLRHLDPVEKAPHINGFNGLNIVDFLVAPHWTSTSFKKLYLGERIEYLYNTKNKIILLNDNQYIDVKDDLYKIIDITD